MASHPEHVRTKALVALAWANGSPTHAHKALKEEFGVTVTAQTLSEWKSRYADEYGRLREQVQLDMEQDAVRSMRARMLQASRAEDLAVERTIDMLEKGQVREPWKAARDMADVKTKNTDKLLALTGRPTQITETRDATQLIKLLAQRKVLKVPNLEAAA